MAGMHACIIGRWWWCCVVTTTVQWAKLSRHLFRADLPAAQQLCCSFVEMAVVVVVEPFCGVCHHTLYGVALI